MDILSIDARFRRVDEFSVFHFMAGQPTPPNIPPSEEKVQ